jgi:hypothetical protein
MWFEANNCDQIGWPAFDGIYNYWVKSNIAAMLEVKYTCPTGQFLNIATNACVTSCTKSDGQICLDNCLLYDTLSSTCAVTCPANFAVDITSFYVNMCVRHCPLHKQVGNANGVTICLNLDSCTGYIISINSLNNIIKDYCYVSCPVSASFIDFTKLIPVCTPTCTKYFYRMYGTVKACLDECPN